MPNAMLTNAATPNDAAATTGVFCPVGAGVVDVLLSHGVANVVESSRIIIPDAKTASRGILLKNEQNVNADS